MQSKLYIMTDLEGVAGISNLDFSSYRKTNIPVCYEQIFRARTFLTNEINSAIEGAIEYGVTEIIVNDGHGRGDCILAEKLNPCALLVQGCNKKDVLPFLDESFDIFILIGAHGMAGSGGCMSHSFSRNVKKIELNNMQIGEVGLYMAVAGYYNVPTLFISGDNVAVEEAKQFVAEIEYVITKESLSQKSSKSISPQTACEKIKKSVYHSLKMKRDLSLFKIPSPYRMKVTYTWPFFSIGRDYLKQRKIKSLIFNRLFSSNYHGNSLVNVVKQYFGYH